VDSYSHKVEVEQRKVEEQKKDTDVTEAKALHLRKLVGGASGAKENALQLQKMGMVLENRLEKAQVKYNQLLSKNKAVRDEIDHLRKERVTFEGIYKKLEDELVEKKGEMASRIEVSNIAYEARDAALEEMAALRAQSDGEQRAFEGEMARLGARLGAGRGRRDEALRSLLYASVQTLPAKDGSPPDSSELGGYEAVFERLRAAPGGDAPPGKVVDNFIAAEDANLSLFNYTTQLKQEVARLNEMLAEQEAELERMKSQNTLEESSQRRGLLAELAAEQERTLGKLEAVRAKSGEAGATFDVLADLAARLAARVGAEPPSDVTGKSSVEAVPLWLGALEHRANEACTMWAAYQATRQAGGTATATHSGPPCPARQASGKMVVVAPSIRDTSAGSGDDDSDSSDAEIPLTSAQIKSKVAIESGLAYEKFLAGGQPKKSTTPQRPASAVPKAVRSPATGAAGTAAAQARGASLQRSASARSAHRRPVGEAAGAGPARPASGASRGGQDKAKKPGGTWR